MRLEVYNAALVAGMIKELEVSVRREMAAQPALTPNAGPGIEIFRNLQRR